MQIEFKVNEPISAQQYISLLKLSGLSERRPIADLTCIEGMVNNSNLIVSAWHGKSLVGAARSMTDFNYACYLSDLAVSETYQKQGIGKKLQVLTQQQLGPHCKLILIAAPTANRYYKKIGFTLNERCWVLDPEQRIVS